MINPEKITKFDRTKEELQEFLLFCILVHGKRAKIQATKLENFLTYLSLITGERLPFNMIDIAMNYPLEDEIEETLLVKALKKFGLGQYTRITQSISDLIELPDLKTVSVEELEKCFGIGPKTARFFIVHSRPNQNYAILDTHILKWLKENGIKNVPKNTPQNKLYAYFEEIFLTMVKKTEQSVAEFDLNIWKSYA